MHFFSNLHNFVSLQRNSYLAAQLVDRPRTRRRCLLWAWCCLPYNVWKLCLELASQWLEITR